MSGFYQITVKGQLLSTVKMNVPEDGRKEKWEPVTAITLDDLDTNLVSTSLIFANFFMGHIPLHTQELFSERITFFYRAIVSEVHILHPRDLTTKTQPNYIF